MPTCGLGQRQLALHTANTTWICSSTDTCRDGFCCLLTQPSFPTPLKCSLPRRRSGARPDPQRTRLADRAAVDPIESDKRVAEALATIDNCPTAPRSVRVSQTVTNFRHAQQGASSGSQPP